MKYGVAVVSPRVAMRSAEICQRQNPIMCVSAGVSLYVSHCLSLSTSLAVYV